MNGISGLVSIMMDDKDYLRLSKLEQLKHDLDCAVWSGISNNFPYEKWTKRIEDIENIIKKEERKTKIKKIEHENMS